MTATAAVVLRTGADVFSHAGLGVPRSLGRLGAPVYWIDPDPNVPAASSRYVRGRVEADPSDEETLLERLLDVGRSFSDRPVLVPVDDRGCLLVATHGERLRPVYRFADQSRLLVERLSNKAQLHELCVDAGIPTPATAFPRSRDDLDAFLTTATLPLVVKPARAWARPGRERAKIVTCTTAEQVRAAFDAMNAPDDPNLIVQEFIPGGPETIWMLNGYWDSDSRCLFAATGYKLRQHPPYTGAATLGICAMNEVVERQARELLTAVAYRGPVDLGFRYDARDGRYKLLDVNPRLGATFRLWVAQNGLDVARALYLDLTGSRVRPAAVPDGRKWLVEGLDLVSARVYRRDGRLTTASWLRSLRGVRECAWWARDDPLPFLRMARTFLLRHREIDRGMPLGKLHQQLVDDHFTEFRDFWEGVYESDDVYGLVLQQRRRRVIEWIDSLDLPPQARVLEVGCGAGGLALELAERGFRVAATDVLPAMIERVGERARERGVDIELRVGDAHDLAFRDESFDLVVALGVVPWLHSPEQGVRELARVAVRGGHVLLTADNSRRLISLADPRLSAPLAPLRSACLRMLGRPDPYALPNRFHSGRTIRRLLAEAGLEASAWATLGFGPFTFRGRQLGDTAGARIHHALQRLADRGVPPLRRAGAQHLVLARRP